MRGSDTVDIENRLESLITRVGEKVCLETFCLYFGSNRFIGFLFFVSTCVFCKDATFEYFP